MKLTDYIEATDRYRRRILLPGVPIIGAALLSLAYLPFLDRVTAAAAVRFGETAAPLIAVAPVVILIAGAFAIAIPLGRRFERVCGIPCEHCGKMLTTLSSIVIASKHCPYCGQRVISET